MNVSAATPGATPVPLPRPILPPDLPTGGGDYSITLPPTRPGNGPSLPRPVGPELPRPVGPELPGVPVRTPDMDFLTHTGDARSSLQSAIAHLYTTPGILDDGSPFGVNAAVADAERAYDQLGMAADMPVSNSQARTVIETARGSVLGGINALTGDTVIAPSGLVGDDAPRLVSDLGVAESYFRNSLHWVDVAERLIVRDMPHI